MGKYRSESRGAWVGRRKSSSTHAAALSSSMMKTGAAFFGAGGVGPAAAELPFPIPASERRANHQHTLRPESATASVAEREPVGLVGFVIY